MTAAVGVMVRVPSSGGKTRLASHLTAVRLSALRAAMLADTLHALRTLNDVTIFFTPDTGQARHEIGALATPAVPCLPQRGEDLGARMLAAIADLLGAGRRGAAILVGSDVPLLSADHVAEASDMLAASGGVVLGPADDGGYYLIGMTEPHRSLFAGIEWGTGSVLTDTLRVAERAGIEARLVRSGYDVDTIEDLRRVERDLELTSTDRCPALRRWFLEG